MLLNLFGVDDEMNDDLAVVKKLFGLLRMKQSGNGAKLVFEKDNPPFSSFFQPAFERGVMMAEANPIDVQDVNAVQSEF